jgi:hypothetical protein
VHGVNASFGIDFRHAVEFSRIGRTPRFKLSFEAPGQLDQLYRSAQARSNPAFPNQPPCVSQRPKPAHACSGSENLQGVRSDRPLPRPALAPTRRTLLTFTTKMQIEFRPIVRTCAAHCSTSSTRCLSSLWSHLSPASPRGRPSRLREVHHPWCRTRSSPAPQMGDGWATIARHPPTEYRTAQQTPLGEWPLVAAECEARGSCTRRHLM